MIDVKAAIKSAYDYFKFINTELNTQVDDLRLEEVELSEDKNFWIITLGYDLPVKSRGGLEDMMIPALRRETTFKREYKSFKVNSGSGQVESMKIRQV